MKNIFYIKTMILIFISGCADQNQLDLEIKLMDILDSDDILGVEGFDTDGDQELDFDLGL